jgi:hypothetical protein
MPQREHHGENFHYIVRYQHTGSYEFEQVEVPDVKATDASRREYVVENQEMYTEYRISVQAANQEGLSTKPVERFIGYSGQGSTYQQICIMM